MSSLQRRLAENLKRLRKRRQLTQAGMAELLDMSLRGYQKYEQEESWPDPNSLAKIAALFAVPVGSLFDPDTHTLSVTPSADTEETRLLDLFRRLNGRNASLVFTYIQGLIDAHQSDPTTRVKRSN